MMGAGAPRGRRHQRGQAVPVIALASAVLVGATALAVDLSLNSHSRRTVQNISDVASLAGAQDLPVSPTQSDRRTAAFSALVTIYRELDQPVPTSAAIWSIIDAGSTCTSVGTQCHVAFSVGGHYSGTVDTPPTGATNAGYDTNGYVEVNLAHADKNNFGRAVGYATSTERSHSIGYHFAPNQSLGLALFADTYVGTGNDGELVNGNIYAQRYVNPQSAGKAGFCAGNGGRIVLGAPQSPSSGGQADILPMTARVIQPLPDCNPLGSPTQLNTTTSGTVNQTVADPMNCSNPIPGMTVTATYSSVVGTCVADPPLEPPTNSFQQPTQFDSPHYTLCGLPALGSGLYSCSKNGANKSALVATTGIMAPGVYSIDHNTNCTPPSCYDIDFSGVTVDAKGVTIILLNGATMGVHNGANVSIDPTREPDGSLCVQTVPTDCRYPVYSAAGSFSKLDIKDNNTTLILYGTVYMVAGTVFCQSNAFLQIPQGQAIVGTWDVQSGNHNNPIITYDAGMVAPETEVLRLAE
jgi:Flp pilus assembly protein TadG